MKKSGFTMIELIFVIVIIGILAAIAIPKLAATRTDAKVAAISQEVQNAVTEIQGYVTAQGGNVNAYKLTEMSQTLQQLSDNGKADCSADNGETCYIYGEPNKKCIKISADEQNLTVSPESEDTSRICDGAKKLLGIESGNRVYQIAGSNVKF